MLSIIIPALDEAKTIGKTLSELQRMEGDFEVLVVDGGSHDATRKIAEQMGVRVIKGPRGVAEQLNTGIEHAKGDTFLFLHADTSLPQSAAAMLAEETGAGGFTQVYSKFGVLSAAQAALNNANARVFKRFSGEQAFFLTREALMAAGGIPDTFLFETEILCENLKKAGIEPKLLDAAVISNDRRFKKGGVSAFLGLNWAHAVGPLGSSPYKLKKHFGKVR